MARAKISAQKLKAVKGRLSIDSQLFFYLCCDLSVSPTYGVQEVANELQKYSNLSEIL